MIAGAALLPVVLSILAALTVAADNDRGSPRAQAIESVVVAATLAAATLAGLLFLGWIAIAETGSIAARGHWTPAVLEREAPISAPLARLALAVGIGLTINAARAMRKELAALAAAHRRLPPASTEVLVLRTEGVDAFAVARWGGRPGRIVLTQGLIHIVGSHHEREAVLTHERSHLRNHHYALRVVVACSIAANPLLRPLRARTALALERWADADAAQATTPATTAAAIATVALAQRTDTALGSLRVAGDHVVVRIEHLLRPPGRRPIVEVVWVAALVVAAVVGISVAGRETEMLFERLMH